MPRFVPILAAVLLLSACDRKTPLTPDPVKCVNQNAINNGAEGLCRFSRVAFYSSLPMSFPVTVTVDGVQVGTITGFYPVTAPGNCSADYTVPFQLTDGQRHDWNARDARGLAASGIVVSSATAECVRVRVF